MYVLFSINIFYAKVTIHYSFERTCSGTQNIFHMKILRKLASAVYHNNKKVSSEASSSGTLLSMNF